MCGPGRCVDGACTIEPTPGPIASQRRGDCQRSECDLTGQLVTVEDTSDVYDDGEQCTYDSCGPGGALNKPLQDGTPCPVTGSGRCFNGACVECISDYPGMTCPGDLVCQFTYCVPTHCRNLQTDQGETDTDCGGSCGPCEVGHLCATGSDCSTGVCTAGICKSPTCSDSVKNNGETGTDCGAPSCPLCPPGQGCDFGQDCTSGVCWAGICEEPSCFDGVRNGDESDVDCGGACEPCLE